MLSHQHDFNPDIEEVILEVNLVPMAWLVLGVSAEIVCKGAFFVPAVMKVL